MELLYERWLKLQYVVNK